MRSWVSCSLTGLLLFGLSLIIAPARLKADIVGDFSFNINTCNVVLTEGQTCEVQFTLKNINTVPVFMVIDTPQTSTNGDKGDPARIQGGDFNNPCGVLSGMPLAPGKFCTATATVTTDFDGDVDPGSKDDNTTTFTVGLRARSGPTSSATTTVKFFVTVRDADEPPPPPPPPPPPVITPEPAMIFPLAIGLILMAPWNAHSAWKRCSERMRGRICGLSGT